MEMLTKTDAKINALRCSVTDKGVLRGGKRGYFVETRDNEPLVAHATLHDVTMAIYDHLWIAGWRMCSKKEYQKLRANGSLALSEYNRGLRRG